MKKTREDELYILGWVLAVCMVIGVWFLRRSQIPLVRVIPSCIFYAFTGYYCPGCGATRALDALLKGHLLRSFLYHPIVDYALFLYLWFMISQSIERISRGKIKIGMKYRDRWLYLALVLLIIHCIIRNLLKFYTGTGMPS